MMATAELVKRENNIAQIKITLGVEEVDLAYKKVIKEFSKNLNIPGFRKGKVPKNIIVQRVGAESVAGAVGDELKDFAIEEALDELKLSPRAGKTRWHSDPDPKEGEGIVYELSIPVLPEVTLPDYKNFELTVPVLAITDEMKDRFRQRLVERFTEFSDKAGAAVDGDAVLLGFSSKDAETGEDAPLAMQDMFYKVGAEGNFPGWDEVIRGSEANAHHDFDFVVPEDFADPRVQGKTLKVSLDVKSVHEMKEPEITAEFVKQHLNLDSLDDFEDHVTKMLTMERDQQVHQMKSEMVMQKIAAEMEAEISEDMISDELDGIVKEYDAQLRQHGTSLDAYVKDQGKTLAEYREGLHETAIQKIKVFLTVKQISEAEEMHASGEDFQRYAYMLMQREGIQPDQLRELINNPEFMREATYQIVREKVANHLAEAPTFTSSEPVDGGEEVKADETPAEEAAT